MPKMKRPKDLKRSRQAAAAALVDMKMGATVLSKEEIAVFSGQRDRKNFARVHFFLHAVTSLVSVALTALRSPLKISEFDRRIQDSSLHCQEKNAPAPKIFFCLAALKIRLSPPCQHGFAPHFSCSTSAAQPLDGLRLSPWVFSSLHCLQLFLPRYPLLPRGGE